MRTVEIMRN